VKECEAVASGLRYAVKVVRGDDEAVMRSVEQEYELLRELRCCPYIVEAVEFFKDEMRGRAYLVLEKVDGASLLEVTATEGPLSGKRTLTCRALGQGDHAADLRDAELHALDGDHAPVILRLNWQRSKPVQRVPPARAEGEGSGLQCQQERSQLKCRHRK